MMMMMAMMPYQHNIELVVTFDTTCAGGRRRRRGVPAWPMCVRGVNASP